MGEYRGRLESVLKISEQRAQNCRLRHITSNFLKVAFYLSGENIKKGPTRARVEDL